MTKTSAELPEQGTEKPSARDLVPAETQYQPRTHFGTGATKGATLVPTHEMSPGLAEEGWNSHWADILAAASNPDFQRAEFVRLVLMEMSSACHELRLARSQSSLSFRIKPLTAEIHALRTLAETARDVTELTAQADVVNLDGPKFLYVTDKLIDAVEQSFIQAECPVLIRDTVMRLLKDNWAQAEAEIRRDFEKAHT